MHQDQEITLEVMNKLVDDPEKNFVASRIEEERERLVDQAITFWRLS